MAEQANKDIRELATVNNVKLWQIAAGLGITDNSFSRKLRFELPDEEKSKIREIIHELADIA